MNQKGGSGVDVRNAHLVDNPIQKFQLPMTFVCKNETEAKMKYALAAKLTTSQKDWLMDLFARNMKAMYVKSTEGWQPRAKKVEMFGKRSRFLIVSVDGKSVAFTHFQFDMDYGRQVLYCFEIQVEKEWRGSGIGGFIMSTLEQIALSLKLPLVVLTVFKYNHEANEFFKSNGYEIDETSPEEEEGTDYIILSKPIDIPVDKERKKEIENAKENTKSESSEAQGSKS